MRAADRDAAEWLGFGVQESLTRIDVVIACVRVGVVLSLAVLIGIGTDPVRQHLLAALVLLAVAVVYAALVVQRPHWENRNARSATWITVLDSVLTLGAVATTGAGRSPSVTILTLVVVAAATRLRLAVTIVLSAVLGAAYLAIVVLVDPQWTPLVSRLQLGVWWAVYLVFTATLAGALSLLVEREAEGRARAWAEAIAERNAAQEERDLRARLLAAYQAQQDGLRVILHEFRTPVSSLQALASELTMPSSTLTARDRATSQRLIADHAEHLSEMLDALSDVAVSQSPAFGSGRARRVRLEEILVAAADAAGLRPPRLRLAVSPCDAVVRLDAQRLRRVVTNLLENAARHGGNSPVDVVASVDDPFLRIQILDRGPGIPVEQLQIVTEKYKTVGESRGTAGLGLWIVEQILRAMDGHLKLDVRAGGGLVADVEIPVT